MTNSLKTVGIIIAGGVVGLLLSAVFISGPTKTLGEVYHSVIEYFPSGLYAGTSNQFAVSATGNITQATSNTATSTFSGGCIQLTATSTANPIKLMFNGAFSGTSTFSGNANGAVFWAFGTCP